MNRSTLTQRANSLSDNAKGTIALLVATLFFSAMVAFVKLLGRDMHVTQILFLRQCAMIAIVSPMIIRGFPGVLTTKRPGLQILRVCFAIGAMLFGFTAVIHLPLADATAISFVKSMFVTVFAVIILGEVVGWRRWMAVAAGFVGVLVMLRPGTAGFSSDGLLALAGAACAGVVMVIIRLLSRTEQPTTILTWQAVGVGLAMTLPGLYYWVWPQPWQWALLAAMGGVSYAGQYFNILAFKWGEASMLASLDYMRLLYAVFFGWLLFDSLPGGSTWAGAAIIVASSIYVIHRETRLKQKIASAPEARSHLPQ